MSIHFPAFPRFDPPALRVRPGRLFPVPGAELAAPSPPIADAGAAAPLRDDCLISNGREPHARPGTDPDNGARTAQTPRTPAPVPVLAPSRIPADSTRVAAGVPSPKQVPYLVIHPVT